MDVEESVSGFKVIGDWGDVVEHGERITRALRAVDDGNGIDEAALREWDEWRPKADEYLDDDLNQKTAEQASVDEGDGEKRDRSPTEDVKTAGEKLTESYESLERESPDEAVEGWKESINYLARAADSASRKALRMVEGGVYKNLMTQVSPYYFDNELVSANLDRTGGDEHVFEVNINDDDLKIRVSNKLADFDRTVDRWHIDTPKETDSAEAAEGHDLHEEASITCEPGQTKN